jgi:hypothetical protein
MKVLYLAMAAALLATSPTTARAAATGDPRPPAVLPSPSFVVDRAFESVLAELLSSSPTLRRQYECIVGSPHVQVRVTLMPPLAVDRIAQTEFRRVVRGELEARVQIPTPLRIDQYGEWLAHELEHVLEQMEGLDLVGLAADRAGGVVKLADGFETERAQRAGREAAREVMAATGGKS